MREHSLIALTMGIRQLVVVINDANFEAEWNEYNDRREPKERYEEAKAVFLNVLKKVGFNPNSVKILPVNAFEGTNLFDFESKSLKDLRTFIA